MPSPKVTVLMPAYNQADYLPAALRGLDAQTFRDFELIACDDASTDATPDILRRGGVCTIHHNENRGSAAAINSAAEEASGKYWTWVSSDNVMTPDWLETLVAYLDANPDAGAVYSGFWYERPDAPPLVIYRPYKPETLVNDENCCVGPSFLIRAEIWRAAGPHTGRISHDLGHWLKVEEACWAAGKTMASIPNVLCHYRVHSQMAGRRLAHLYDAPEHHAEARRRRCA